MLLKALCKSHPFGLESTKQLLRTMKLTAIIFLMACLTASANGFSQITLSETNVPLQKVFKEIKKQSGYNFLFQYELLEQAGNVTVKVYNVSLKEAINECLKGKNLTYEIFDKTIVIKQKEEAQKKEAPLLHLIDVKGRVVNEIGEPVIVTVTVKGTSKAISTNNNGDFLLKGVDENAILVISGVSIETSEIKLSGRNELTIKAVTKISTQEEVTINTGYQKIAKERATGSYSKVENALLSRQPSTNLFERLDGITNSLLVDKRAGEKRFQVRGLSTLNDGQPLIVLDNFPFNGNVNDINPNDILDITVLKDAASASIWGAKAANGVIVITTKKSRYNQPTQVTYNSNARLQEKINQNYYPSMSTSEYIDVEQFLFEKGFYDAKLINTIRYPTISPVVEILNKKRSGLLSEQVATQHIDALRNLDTRNEYDKYLLRSPISLQQHLNFGGGSNNLRYNFSVGYDRNSDEFKGTGVFKRLTVNSGLSFKPINRVELSINTNFSQSNSRSGAQQFFDLNIYPYAQLADAAGNHLAVVKDYRMSFVDTAGSGKLLDWHYKPLDEVGFLDSKNRVQLLLTNLNASVRLTNWLSVDLRYQYGHEQLSSNVLHRKETYFVRSLVNQFTKPGSFERNIPVGGFLDTDNSDLVSNNLRGQINFNSSWAGKHEISGLVAAESGESRTRVGANRVYGYNDANLTYNTNIDFKTLYPLYLGGTSIIENRLSYGEFINRSVSFLGNASYTYNSRYTIYASARKDGSNIFGVNTNNRWKPLWSLGTAWDISKETFYDIDWLPLLKLRFSYGYTGNTSNTTPALTTILYSPVVSVYTGTPIASIVSPPNPDLRWEETRILNLGADFTIFQNRITGSFEWFVKKSKDIVSEFPIDPTLGIFSAKKNVANLKTKGFDVQLSSLNLDGKLQWRTQLNLSYCKAIVTNYFNNFITTPVTSPGINPLKGQIAYGLYSYKWAGLDPLNGDPQGYLGKQVSKDYNGILNDSFQHQVFHGSSIPLYFGNVINALSFKGVTVSANITYRFAYYFRRPSVYYSRLFEEGTNRSADYSKRWMKSGDENFTTVPSMTYPSNSQRDQFYYYSEVNVQRGDHIRLSDMRVSYDFNNAMLQKMWIHSLQLYLYANNLNVVLWKANHSGIDPDYTGATLIIPPSRTWAIGLNVNFK